MINRHEPTSYAQLLAMPEFLVFHELFVRAACNPFLTTLEGHDDAVSLQFPLDLMAIWKP